MSFDTIAGSPVGTHMLDHLVADGFASARPLTDLSEAALYEVVARAAFEVSSAKWAAAPPARSWPWESRASVEAVDALAREVTTCPAARWWSESSAKRPQVWIGRAASAPSAGLMSRGLAGKPSAAIWTSSAIAGLPSAWWPVLRDGPDHTPPDDPQAIWRLTPEPGSRVFEIRTVADWRWLCETFPGPVVDGWVTPGWETAAEELDGVHLTVEGLIHAQGTQIETERGPAKLDDWDAESTAWLRWSVVTAERLAVIAVAPAAPVTRGRASPRTLRRS